MGGPRRQPGAQRILAALDAAGDAAPVRERANALLLAAWIEASTGHLELRPRPHRPGHRDRRRDRRRRPAGACRYYLAYVVSHDGEFGRRMELTDRSARCTRAGSTMGSGRELALRALGRRSRPVTSCVPSTARDQVQHWLEPLTTRGCTSVTRRCSANSRVCSTGSTMPSLHIGRAADTSRRLGFLQTEAYQVASLGRAQCQAGDYDDRRGDAPARNRQGRGTGDVRMAALGPGASRPRAPRARRDPATPGPRSNRAAAWHRAAGGGEQAALGECLLAAMDAADGFRAQRNDSSRSSTGPQQRRRPRRGVRARCPGAASPPTQAMRPRTGSATRPIGAWTSRRTSSPNATESTPSGAASA